MGSHLRTSADSPPRAFARATPCVLGPPVAGREAVRAIVLGTWLSLGRQP